MLKCEPPTYYKEGALWEGIMDSDLTKKLGVFMKEVEAHPFLHTERIAAVNQEKRLHQTRKSWLLGFGFPSFENCQKYALFLKPRYFIITAQIG